jgi:mono/diheme cytochrome c family protein
MNTRPRWLLLCFLFLAIGAGAQEAAMRAHMQEHLVRVNAIRDAILASDLESLREPAIWLADHEPLPDTELVYEPFMLALRQQAADIAVATDIEMAAAATARIAVACGNCHRAVSVEPDLGQSKDPPAWSDLASHMQRHSWAVDRLWEGLIGPSDIAWSRGIRMLADAPLLGVEPAWDDTDATGDELARRVHELGVDAAAALTPEARITIYKKMLATCAECHASALGGPRPD